MLSAAQYAYLFGDTGFCHDVTGILLSKGFQTVYDAALCKAILWCARRLRLRGESGMVRGPGRTPLKSIVTLVITYPWLS